MVATADFFVALIQKIIRAKMSSAKCSYSSPSACVGPSLVLRSSGSKNYLPQLDDRHRNMTKGKNPSVISRLRESVVRSKTKSIREEIQDCSNDLKNCAFTPNPKSARTKKSPNGEGLGDYGNKGTEGLTRNMMIRQVLTTEPAMNLYRRGQDFPAVNELGALHGKTQFNQFLRTQQHHPIQCDGFGTSCGIIKNNGTIDKQVQDKLNSNLPNSFQPSAIDSMNKLGTSPSWQRGWKPYDPAPGEMKDDKTNMPSYEYRARPASDNPTFGYEDPSITDP